MAVNYTITNVPITVSSNSSWGSQDIPTPGTTTGDGVPDSGNMPLRMIISPLPDYTVSKSNFKLSGLSAPAGGGVSNLYPGWDGGMVQVADWNDGDESGDDIISLPEGVNKVRIYDTGTPGEISNTIVVLAYLDSNYQTLTENTTITLDIDGDADPIPVDVVSVWADGNIDISLKLEGIPGVSDSHCTVIPVLYGGWLEGSPDNYNFEITTTGETTGTITATPGATNPISDFFGSAGGPLINFEETYGASLFFIIPDEGYTLSRHNLWLKHEEGDFGTGVSGTINIDGYGTFDTNTNVIQYQAAIGIPAFTTSPPTQPPTISLPEDFLDIFDWVGSLLGPQFGTFPPGGTGCSYDTTRYLNPNFEVFYEWAEGTGDEAETVESNWQSFCGNPGAAQMEFGSTSQMANISLVDVGEFSSGFQCGVDPPGPYASHGGWGWSNIYGLETNINEGGTGTIPDEFCPNDWDGNAVLVVIKGMDNIETSVVSDDNIIFKIYGSAMALDGSECVDCEDGIDC